MRFSGKTAIVTGGARGIGYAIAHRFLSEGAQVVIADIDDEKGEAVEQELSKLGDVTFVSADVGERLDVHNLVAATVDTYGDIDILINNAGIVIGGDFLDISEDDLDQVMRVNLKGAFLCSQAVAKLMIKRVEADGPAGCIINIRYMQQAVPAWHPDYRDPLPLGQSYSPAITEQVFGRLIETRQWIEAFKGTPSPGPSFRSIARDYFSFAWQSATSPLYD